MTVFFLFILSLTSWAQDQGGGRIQGSVQDMLEEQKPSEIGFGNKESNQPPPLYSASKKSNSRVGCDFGLGL